MRWLLTLFNSKQNADRALQPSDQPHAQLLCVVNAAYLAMKIGAELSYSKRKRNQLFFQVIRHEQDQLKKHEEPVVAAAAHMLEWCEKGEDLPEKISQYKEKERVIRAMQAVYFNHKEKLFPERACIKKHVKRNQQDIWYVYRDVLAAATQNKLMLIEVDEVECFKEGAVLIEGRIGERSDISKIRNQTRQRLEARQFSKSAIMSILLVLSEAMTNVFKHASHGKVMIVEKDESLHLIVEDSGTGFPLEQLPKATLYSGYSTQDSMGQGFTVMLKIASFVHLHTSEKGSTIVISFDQPERTGVSTNLNTETVAQVWSV
ncbi:ATP-binding protein [Jeotgalibacillus malaysiensis]|uniref:ATP-binding protein n=1 Tax=Jeotgalibacillus malaysiensis TaxID=1508404 RepID=UPI00384E27C4